MSASSRINEENNIAPYQKINEFLSPELCEDAGIIIIDMTENSIDLGAMNLDYIKVKKVISSLEKDFNLEVTIKQITSFEWETWFENTHSTSVENIQKNTIQNLPNETIVQTEDENDYDNSKNSYSFDTAENNEIEYQDETDNDLIDDANDEALIRLAQANIGDDSEMDHDILFGEELTDSSDPVISGVASILSKCFSVKGSDIHAEPLEDRLRIRYRIDGVLKEAFAFPKSHVNPIISRIKIMSKGL